MEPGVSLTADGASFSVLARDATEVELCLFTGERETRLPMQKDGDFFTYFAAGVMEGQRYGYRAHGPYRPADGLHFDPAKLLVDPYAVTLDRRFAYNTRLATFGTDTAPLVPKAIVTRLDAGLLPEPPKFRPGGLIYELNVRAFSLLHPDIPEDLRGTVAALAHPAAIAHFKKLSVNAVELMPIVAWIDERHLASLGLRNAWGYNPVVPMALDPGLAPGGIAELRQSVKTLQENNISVILDLVLNHTGESDLEGPTLSLRGLDNRCYAKDATGDLRNDTGTGNMLDSADAHVRRMMLDTLRHFVRQARIDGFRFDLATILARGPDFDSQAPIFAEIAADPILQDRLMIAEPWDIGADGYQLGQFPQNWLEWNDRYRDDVRRFWRGDPDTAGVLATRMMGSSDIFKEPATRTVNFLASHDGFTLADTVSYETRHNELNGEANRDGQAENFSWNNGVEGETEELDVAIRRQKDVRALLATLFASRGTIQLTAGDEFGRTQKGNNNAYAQDNPITWLDWSCRNLELENFVAALAKKRWENFAVAGPGFLSSATWRDLDGEAMTDTKWREKDLEGFVVEFRSEAGKIISIRVDRAARRCEFSTTADKS